MGDIQIFMGSSTGNMLVGEPKTLENIFAKTPVLVTTVVKMKPQRIAKHYLIGNNSDFILLQMPVFQYFVKFFLLHFSLHYCISP